jgi:alpha-tubulin suppressor-like RCC1 family protein
MAEVIGKGNLQVAAGYGHTVVLRGDGSTWAVGHNGHGQLGDGGNVSRGTPAPMAGVMGEGNGVIADVIGVGSKRLAAGATHTVILREGQ